MTAMAPATSGRQVHRYRAVVTQLQPGVAGIVRRKRKENSLSQAQLAEKANLSRTSIAFIEAAKQECGLETFVRVALALGTEPPQLLQEVWSPGVVEDPFALKVLKKASR